ncbi:TonB-dependent receptor [candidate division KSB1 bacterium]|nr:TonB-dependent receptor [candidate division KSB1 bacterium]NIS23639.1 TonB-dependent receptor [candidate division KSB1 bacterium]NIT70563.1 TonB-dependent receptor [candidate division KSB1 bacterium]NIU93852.1 TonB-dependent receptor [candidate division KSB1 bacterium]NIX70244.1 TonB-dependent receptor [candidate division KSB1 bacterium]
MISARLSRIFLAGAFGCLFLGSPGSILEAGEKEDYAKIVGQVVDKNEERPLPNVQIYVESVSRGDVTDSEGKFVIDRLPPGVYDLTLQLQGYKTIQKKGISLSADEIVDIHAAMDLDIIELEHLVVTATRRRESAYEIPQLVSIIGAKKIQERSKRETPELLREEVGVVVQKTNQGGGSPIIRGLKANKLLFLVDGIRLNNATYRGGNIQYLNTVDSGALERIEVVHGPNSVLYGSDALGGVINVITRKPKLSPGDSHRFRASVSASLSTADNTQSTQVDLITSNSRWGWLLEGSFKKFGDIRRGENGGETLMRRLRNDSRTDRVLKKTQSPNGYDAYALNSKARLKISEFQELTLSYQLDRQLGVPRYDVVEALQDSIREFDPQERDLVYLTYSNQHASRFFNAATITLSFHRQFERRIRQRFGSRIRTTDRIRTLTPGFQLQFTKVVANKHHLVYGAEFYYDKVATSSFERNTETGARSNRTPVFPDGSSFSNFGVYVRDAFELDPRWHLNVGGRFSVFNLKAPFETVPESSVNFGTVEQSSTSLTGSLGSQFYISDAVSFVTNIAQGFRTPNLDDVSKLGPGKGSSFFDVPNPDLVPEKSISLDGGFKIYSGELRANVIGFYNSINDLLVRRPAEFNDSPFVIEESDTLLVFRKENAGKAFTTGFTLNTECNFRPNWLLFGNLSYTFGKNVSQSEPLTGVPPFNGLFGMRWNAGKYWIEMNTRFAAEQTRLAAEDKEDLRIPEGGTPGWYTLNLRSGWQLFDAVSIKFAVNNLLDRNYREHLSGFNAPGRNFIFGAHLRY